MNHLSVPTLEHVRKMKKPVLTVKAVSRYNSPNAGIFLKSEEMISRCSTTS